MSSVFDSQFFGSPIPYSMGGGICHFWGLLAELFFFFFFRVEYVFSFLFLHVLL